MAVASLFALQPAVDHQERGPEPGMLEARVREDLELCLPQGRRPGDLWVLESTIELRDELGGNLVVHLPEGRHGTPRTRLDGDAGQSEGGPIFAVGGVAGAERQELEGFVAE